MNQLLLQPLFLIALCSILGALLGKLGYKHFKLGSSATLFVGLLISYLSSTLGVTLGQIPTALFTASLIAFIVAVGLRASKHIKGILRTYGFKFMFLAVAVTAAGALTTYVLIHYFAELRYEMIGTYVGALTSSPGLATALELSEFVSKDSQSAVGMGYAIAYIPGVLIVIVFSQWMGKDVVANSHQKIKKEVTSENKNFDLTRFFIVIAIGIVLGSIQLPIGKNMTFSLGVTGGTLVSALFMGSSFKGYTFDSNVLEVIKSMGLSAFLAIVGLNFGQTAAEAIQSLGMLLLVVGFLTGSVSIIVGYIFGKYILKMSDPVLVGGICGSMTSTPGLGAAMEAFDDEEVVIGYGAAYPFALLTVIIFSNFLFG